MTIRRLTALVFATTVIAAACSSSTSEPAEPVSDGDAEAASFSELVSGLARLSIPSDQYPGILEAGCDAWVPGMFDADSASFSQWIHELFGAGAIHEPESVDAAFTTACAEHRDDPMAFVASVLGDLDLSVGELLALVDEACAGYRTRRVANAEDAFAPEPMDPLVADVVADAGLDRSDLTRAVDDFCEVP